MEMNNTELVIPEDLKEQHRIFSTSKNVRPTAEEYVLLIERVARREQQNKKLRNALERLVDETVQSFGPSSYDMTLNVARATLEATK